MRLLRATILILMSFFAYCTTSKIRNAHSQMEQSYLYDFKLNYFRKLLIRGFNESEAIKSVIASDRSGYGEPLLSIEDYQLIDSLTGIDNSVMLQDSINRVGRVSEGAQGKQVLSYALLKYESKWLDSLAKERWQLYLKIHKE